MSFELLEFLSPVRLTEVVDIGANPIDGDPPYKPMLDARLCRVTGFEPQEKALAKLNQTKGDLERYLPYVLFDGSPQTLKVCRAPGMTSLFEPDPVNLSLFDYLRPLGTVLERIDLPTQRLDDVGEIEILDFLKMDIQGAELTVLQCGRSKLAETVVVQTEVSFTTIYKDQPSFGDIDIELRRQGFVPHCFVGLRKWPIAPYMLEDNPLRPLNHLFETDAVYVRDIARPELMSDEQLKHLALIAYVCYGSKDLAVRMMVHLVARGAISRQSLATFLEQLKASR
jgi:FkbM family methyltransferase